MMLEKPMEEYRDILHGGSEMDKAEQQRVMENALKKVRAAQALNKTISSEAAQCKIFAVGRKRRAVALIAALLCLCTVTVLAAGLWLTENGFDGLFPEATMQQLALLEKAGQVVGQTVTQDGTTVTLEGVVGGSSTHYFLFTVSPKGYQNGSNKQYKFEGCEIGIGSLNSLGPLAWRYEVDNPTPNGDKLQFIVQPHFHKDMLGEKVFLQLDNLVEVYQDEYGAEYEAPVSTGKWSFEFRLDYTPAEIELAVPSDATYITSYGQKTLMSACISPISVQVEYSTGFLPEGISIRDLPHLDPKAHFEDGVPVIIHFQDGSTMDYQDVSNFSSNRGPHIPGNVAENGENIEKNLTITMMYDRLIDLSAVTFLEVGGIKIPVNQ